MEVIWPRYPSNGTDTRALAAQLITSKHLMRFGHKLGAVSPAHRDSAVAAELNKREVRRTFPSISQLITRLQLSDCSDSR